MSHLETITVYYLKNQDVSGGRWYVKDYFGEILGDYSKKRSALDSARQFAKDRAKASGAATKLVIKNKDGSVSDSHKYRP